MEQSPRASKTLVLFVFLLLASLVFLAVAYSIILSDRKLPNLTAKRGDGALRGSIYSSDGFLLASSRKLYRVSVNRDSIDPSKMGLFVNLFSIYSGLSRAEIGERLQKRGMVVLSYDIDAKRAYAIKQLAQQLNNYGVFRELEDRNGRVLRYGLSVAESGEKRDYSYGSSMEPLLGYVQKSESELLTRAEGVKGIERSYEDRLKPLRGSLIEGSRDIGFNIILNREATFQKRADGYDVILSPSLRFQRKLEALLDQANTRFRAKEIIVGAMEVESGKLVALASTSRFNPNSIRSVDYESLNNTALEHSFEPGSVIKPAIFSLLLEQNLLNLKQVIPLEGGRYRLRSFIITDVHRYDSLSAEDVLVFSSNVGMAKITQNIDPKIYFNGLKLLGFSESTGVDLPYEKTGTIPSIELLKGEVYRATASYGYGMRATFMQLLKMYNAIKNDGVMVPPYAVEYLVDSEGAYYKVPRDSGVRVMSSATASTLQDLLVKIVERGTGKKAVIDGLLIGGKTGTAHIAKGGRYLKKYNSSFFGFADDGNKRYTIGVVIFEPDVSEGYLAGSTAVPLFSDVVNLFIQEKYLVKRTP